jgi:hypothetical protein
MTISLRLMASAISSKAKIQERYGLAKDQVKKEVDTWYNGQTWWSYAIETHFADHRLGRSYEYCGLGAAGNRYPRSFRDSRGHAKSASS